MTCHQAIVWIDCEEAHILRMDNGLQHESTILAHGGEATLPLVEPGSGQGLGAVGEPDYFHRVARALDTADEILIVGPSGTNAEFAKYMHKNDHAIDPRILGVETVAGRLETDVTAFAKLYFSVGAPRRSGNGSGHEKSG